MAKRKLSQDTLSSATSKKSRLHTPSTSTSAEPTQIQSQPSALLRLPPELLNKIYEYVLTADGGLLKLTPQYSRNNIYGARPISRLPFLQYHVSIMKVERDFNQMKFVCRKFYEETASRELNLNTLVLEQVARHEMEPSEQLPEFERLCSPTKFSWIKRIELHIKALAMAGSEILRYFLTSHHLDAYVRAAQWCRQHPEVDVRYVLNSFTWNACCHLGSASEGFVNQGIVLLKTLRNVDKSYLNSDRALAQELLSYGGSLRGRRKKESWYAPNLKFFPSQSVLDEEYFRRHAGTEATGVEGGVEKWIEVARSWITDGF